MAEGGSPEGISGWPGEGASCLQPWGQGEGDARVRGSCWDRAPGWEPPWVAPLLSATGQIRSCRSPSARVGYGVVFWTWFYFSFSVAVSPNLWVLWNLKAEFLGCGRCIWVTAATCSPSSPRGLRFPESLITAEWVTSEMVGFGGSPAYSCPMSGVTGRIPAWRSHPQPDGAGEGEVKVKPGERPAPAQEDPGPLGGGRTPGVSTHPEQGP